MIRGPARYFRHNAFEPELAQIKRIDERIDRANRIALINPFIQAFGQQSRLPTIRPNQEALHRFPPPNREENHNIQDVFTQPGSFTTGVPSSHFRNAPKTGRKFKPSVSTLCATSRHRGSYSITSSACAISVGGTVRPSIRAVWELMTNSNLDACKIGRSTGRVP